MLKRPQTPGEKDGLITLVQLSHMVLCRLEKFQMAKQYILITLLPQSKPLIMLLKLEDKIQSMLKRLLMHGDMEPPQVLDQYSL